MTPGWHCVPAHLFVNVTFVQQIVSRIRCVLCKEIVTVACILSFSTGVQNVPRLGLLIYLRRTVEIFKNRDSCAFFEKNYHH